MGMKLLILFGILCIGIGYYLLFVPPDSSHPVTPKEEQRQKIEQLHYLTGHPLFDQSDRIDQDVLRRVYWGMGLVIAGGFTLTVWLYKRSRG